MTIIAPDYDWDIHFLREWHMREPYQHVQDEPRDLCPLCGEDRESTERQHRC